MLSELQMTGKGFINIYTIPSCDNNILERILSISVEYHNFLCLDFNDCCFIVFRVMFSDESTIQVLNNRVQKVHRTVGEEFKPECLKKTNKFSQDIMVWGDISVYGVSRLHILVGTRNQYKCIKDQ